MKTPRYNFNIFHIKVFNFPLKDDIFIIEINPYENFQMYITHAPD